MEKIDNYYLKKTKRWLNLLSFCLFFFIGQMGIAQVDYTQSFTGGANSWTTTGGYSGASGYTGARFCSAAGAVRLNLYNSATTGTIVSPLVGTTNGGEVTLTYSYKVTNYNSNTASPANFGSAQVQYKIGANGTWTTVQTLGNGGIAHVSQNTCVVREVSFMPPIGQLYLRFNVSWFTGDWEFLIDDVSVLTTGAPPTCMPPSNLTATPISLTDVNISWNDSVTEPAEGYVYAVTTSPTAPRVGDFGCRNFCLCI
jgi:hypothetical protein